MVARFYVVASPLSIVVFAAPPSAVARGSAWMTGFGFGHGLTMNSASLRVV
jgi:hypothetical protein